MMAIKLLGAVSLWLCFLASSRSQEQDKNKSEAKTQKVDLAADLAAQAPAEWKFQKPDRQFRTHEFVFPSAEQGGTDGFLMITHFGKGGGGGLEANLKRWYDMVEQPDGSSTEKVAKKDEIKLTDGKVVWLDMTGTYLDRPSPMSQQVTKRPGYRLFTAMIDAGKEGPYWIRAYGPEPVMKAQRDGFEKFLKSIAKK
jgi:hypothetical protein